MNKIEFNRIGVDGNSRTLSEIETLFCDDFEGRIYLWLGQIVTTGLEKTMVSIIRNHLHKILTARPEKLEKWSIIVDRYRRLLSSEVQYPPKHDNYYSVMSLGEALSRAFNYNYFRESEELRNLAMRLNVKTCPYCNMHFTLYAEDDSGQEKYAKFQFDHFYDKKMYPMFSMSLYNLVPSCSVCNGSKKQQKLSIAFNPYYGSISRSFFFEADDVLELLYGMKKADQFSIKMIPVGNPTEFAEYENAFHLRALYSRHGDMAREVFDKAYLASYYGYPNNFPFIPGGDYSYLRRLWLGVYTEEKDIEKRPMTKFCNDLEEQAFSLYFSEDS